MLAQPQQPFMVRLLISCDKISASRPGQLRLCLQGGSVFDDFDLDYFGIVALRSISFDGFGCYRVEGLTTRMSARDSQLLIESVTCHQLDSILVDELLRKYFRENAAVLWSDALSEHDIL